MAGEGVRLDILKGGCEFVDSVIRSGHRPPFGNSPLLGQGNRSAKANTRTIPTTAGATNRIKTNVTGAM